MHQSAQVMFYNNTWASELGFDAAPQTADEFKEQACAAAAANDADDTPDNDGTGGLCLLPRRLPDGPLDLGLRRRDRDR